MPHWLLCCFVACFRKWLIFMHFTIAERIFYVISIENVICYRTYVVHRQNGQIYIIVAYVCIMKTFLYLNDALELDSSAIARWTLNLHLIHVGNCSTSTILIHLFTFFADIHDSVSFLASRLPFSSFKRTKKIQRSFPWNVSFRKTIPEPNFHVE